jgi:hypothetical protein
VAHPAILHGCTELAIQTITLFLAILSANTFGLYYFPLERYLFLHNYIFAVYGLAQQQ